MSQALIVIDLQNDYFPEGRFPLADTEAALIAVEQAIAQARQRQWPVILVQHVADAPPGLAPFFEAGSEGVALHPRIRAAAPEAPVVVKHAADSFYQTDLADRLVAAGVTGLLLCGMMTHNCVTHTALSRAAEGYRVKVLSDASTTVTPLLHQIALGALVSTRAEVTTVAQAFAA